MGGGTGAGFRRLHGALMRGKTTALQQCDKAVAPLRHSCSGYSWRCAGHGVVTPGRACRCARSPPGGGDYFFRTFFDLTGYDASSAVMTFQCAIDNYPASANSFHSLNGGAFGGSCGNTPSYQFVGVNTVNSGFASGINTLTFHVTGDGTTDGLVVGNMSLTANAVTSTPEPASMVLLATGLVGVFGVVRRRRSA